MRLRLPWCAALCLASSCAPRLVPSAGPDRPALTGVPVPFGQDQKVPDDATVEWDFGDGTPSVRGQGKGAAVTHAFARPGDYVVTQILPKSGDRARAHIAVQARPITMAVPADARAALIVRAPWAHLDQHRNAATRLALQDFFDQTVRGFSEGLGFDALDPAQAEKNGFDPATGFAVFTVPQDPEALLVAIGVTDGQRALTAVRRLFTRESGATRFSGGPYQLEDRKLPDGTLALLGKGAAGERVAAVQHFGVLYLRTAGATDPLVALQPVLALPGDQGLERVAAFRTAMERVGPGDAQFYSPRSGDAQDRMGKALAGVAFSISDEADRTRVRFFGQLRNVTGSALDALFTSAHAPGDLAARIPGRPAAYARMSVSPRAWFELAQRNSPQDAARSRERVKETTGLDLEKDLLPAFTGNVGVAVYLDAMALLEAMHGEQIAAFDRSRLLIAAELDAAHLPQLRAALDRVVRSGDRGPDGRLELPGGGVFYHLNDNVLAAIQDGTLLLSLGVDPDDAEEAIAAEAQTGAPSRRAPPGTVSPGAGTPGSEIARDRAGKHPASPRKLRKPDKAKGPVAIRPDQLGPLAPVLLRGPDTPTLADVLRRQGLEPAGPSTNELVYVDLAGFLDALERAARSKGGALAAAAHDLRARASGVRDALLEVHPAPDGLIGDLTIRFTH